MSNLFVGDLSDIITRGVSYLEKEIEEGIIPFQPQYAETFYFLAKFGSHHASRFIDLSKTDDFWGGDDPLELIFDYPEQLFYLKKMELDDNPLFWTCYDFFCNHIQTLSGTFSVGNHGEIGPIRALILIDADSIHSELVISYFLDNWKDLDLDILPEGVLALAEFDFFKYEGTINDIVGFIILHQHEDGYFGKSYDFDTTTRRQMLPTAESINVIAKIYGPSHPAVIKGVNWLINQQRADDPFPAGRDNAAILLCLLSVGGGPTISVEDYEWKSMLELQKYNYVRPCFIHTSPIFDKPIQVRELHSKIVSMLNAATDSIKICSLYIDMLYEDIISIQEKQPNIEVKIISRPAKDLKGMREKIGRNVLHLLNIATKGNIRTNEIVHCRMIIVDDKEMIVSTSDLTRDQLFDEFNAGIYTKDIECIKKANIFFDNIWKNSEKNSN